MLGGSRGDREGAQLQVLLPSSAGDGRQEPVFGVHFVQKRDGRVVTLLSPEAGRSIPTPLFSPWVGRGI